MNWRVRWLLFALIGAGALYVGVVVAFAHEREYTVDGTQSPRVEGRWELTFLGKNSDGVDCARDFSSIEIHFDEWFANNPLVSDERWGGRLYSLLARGRLSVSGKEAPAFLAFAVATDGKFPSGPTILIDPAEDRGPILTDSTDGPLSGCGWKDRLSIFLQVVPDSTAWDSDRLLVAFGSSEDGALRPHEYARASSD